MQDLKSKIDALNKKANDDVMGHLGQAVQLAQGAMHCITEPVRFKDYTRELSAAFNNAPAGQSYADTLNNYIQGNKSAIKTTAGDIESAYAGIQAGITIVKSLNTEEAVVKANDS